MSRARFLVLIVVALAMVGCAAPGPHRAGTAATPPPFRADATSCPGLQAPSKFAIPVAYVEIDEQGSFQDRSQVERALGLIEKDEKPKYVVVFVHGWFHNAAADPEDDNIRGFKCALDTIQRIDDNSGEEVIGIYIGWRGESWRTPLVKYATFWDRKNTSEEIGRGSLVEFFMRLEGAVKPRPDSENKLMVVGHSFGASVVFNSLSQILLGRFILDAEKLASAKAAPTHAQSKPGLVSGYGDLVILVNPAIEATRIVPFFSSLNEYTRQLDKDTNMPRELLSTAQPARLVILSSEGDWATRRTFPTARVFSTLLEYYQDWTLPTPYAAQIPMQERRLDRQTMGNVTELQTHEPLRRTAESPWDGKCPPADREWLSQAIDERKKDQRQKGELATGAGWSRTFDGTAIALKHRGVTVPTNPLWIMAVDTRLIPDHNGIANETLLCFFNALLGDPKKVKEEGEKQEQRLQEQRQQRGR